MNVADVEPTVTVTLAGTVAAAAVSLTKVTVLCAAVPAAGALNVTVAVEFANPPTTLAGLSVRETTAGGGVTVRAVLWVPPLSVEEIFAVTVEATV